MGIKDKREMKIKGDRSDNKRGNKRTKGDRLNLTQFNGYF